MNTFGFIIFLFTVCNFLTLSCQPISETEAHKDSLDNQEKTENKIFKFGSDNLLNSHKTATKNEKDFAKKIVNPYQIIFFWFGHDNPEQIFPMSKVKIWEGSPDAVQFMRQNFMSTYEAAATGKLNHWQNHPESLLALIILLDQFPRKVYAGQSKMFATDNLALGLVLEGIKTEKDLELTPVQRLFFYMPLQRSESPLIQKQSVKVYEKLYQDSAESIKPFINEFLNLAKYNKKNIDEYGKFAHRDKILNRHKPLNNLN